ncbi:hypothetical protein CGRA01v4_07165 [Colletotrichum graminicola]|nr:hypothetical protein CGRA01v4_07165 [Colletotrichum graminicola]
MGWFRRPGRVCVYLVVPCFGVLINSGSRSTRNEATSSHKAGDGFAARMVVYVS